jgi:SagB-type dehydrogenase family enzyme
MSLPLAFGLRAGSDRLQTDAGERAADLPAPVLDGSRSLESVLRERRSVREYARVPLTLAEVAQLAWAAQGVTETRGRRTAPSAGALYPLEILVVAGAVTGLAPGVYRYRPATHDLLELERGDVREPLAVAALGQEWLADAPLVLAVTAVQARTTGKYGERGERYVHIEVGLAAQNVQLQATALGLGSVVVGAFDDERVHRRLGLDEGERPLALLPVGRRR